MPTLEEIAKFRIISKICAMVVIFGMLSALIFGYISIDVFESPTVSMIVGATVGLLFAP